MQYKLIKTPPGWMAAAWSQHGLCALTLPADAPHHALQKLADYLRLTPQAFEPSACGAAGSELADMLYRYFAGQRCRLNFPVDLSWATPFQRQVLKAVQNIPYGQTRSYRQIAETIGRPAAARAVGNAVGKNRLLLVVPCHRVIKQDGTLGGFGATPAWKEKLLNIEGVTVKK